MAVVAILGALDTKGTEIHFLKEQVEGHGHSTLVIDLGILNPPAFTPDVPRHQVAAAAGQSIDALISAGDRGTAVSAMAAGIERIVPELFAAGRLQGVLGIGGSAGTAMATAAMRALPLGVPKVMISTVAGGNVSPFVGVKDVVMFPSIVDISGLNRISRTVLAQAAAAVCGMIEVEVSKGQDRPVVAATMFGNTTPCVELARAEIEKAGYEVLVFHATGTGGLTLESLIDAGFVAGVLDVTTTEWADELVGGVMSAGPRRLEAAARTATPAVVAPGCLDMVNFWAPDTVPEKFQRRVLYHHNPNVTLMRTTPEECAKLGGILAEKLNASKGPAAVYLPLGGVSALSAPGKPFHCPAADEALFSAIKNNLHPRIPVHEIDANINDAEFAEAITRGLLEMLAP